MTEKIYSALMQLFALVSAIDADTSDVGIRQIVKFFLKANLNSEFTDAFLKQFDSHYQGLLASKDRSVEGRKKKVSGGSVRVLRICNDISSELDQSQKLYVLVRLMEFVANDVASSDNKADFVETVAQAFNFSKGELDDLNRFVVRGDYDSIDGNLILRISDKVDEGADATPHVKHIQRSVEGNLYVFYSASTNIYLLKYDGGGTVRLNSTEIQPKRIYVLGPGSIVNFSRSTPIYYATIQKALKGWESSDEIVFKGEDVEFHFKNSNNGIQKFSFCEESGHLVGIMGGSGVGKSTLVNILNGNIKPSSGSITINGLDLYTSDKLKGIIGYVPQDDLLFEDLTVFDNLYYNAKLCFAGLTEEELKQRVDETLQKLELYDYRHLKVGSPTRKIISGGQRKRLNIALELIREPSILIIDEPTSGLSSMDSELLMGILKEQTVLGKLVIVNIHQPSSSIYKLLDRLIILDRGGYPVYYGNAMEALSYFKSVSDSLMMDGACIECGNIDVEKPLEIIEAKIIDEQGRATKDRKVSPLEWYRLFMEKIDSKFNPSKPNDAISTPKSNLNLLGVFGQLGVFVIRSIKSKIANLQFMVINLLVAPLLAFLLSYFIRYTGDQGTGYMFSQNENIPAYLFMIVIVGLFLGMTMSAEEIIKDRKILQRESFLKLSWGSYVHSKIMVLAGFALVQAASFVLVGNTILEVKGHFLIGFLIMFSTIVSSTLIGLNLSAIFSSAVAVYVTIPLILVPQLLLSGVIVDYSKINETLATEKYTPFLGDMMISRWAYEALVVNMFRDNDYEKHFFDIERESSHASFENMFVVETLKTKLNGLRVSGKEEESDVRLIKNEIDKLGTETGLVFSGNFNSNDSALIPESTVSSVEVYLQSVTDHFNEKNHVCIGKKRTATERLAEVLGGAEEIAKVKKQSHNQRLEDIVRGRNLIGQIMITQNDELFQLKDAIFHMPENNYGRAHFYAAEKNLLGHHIDTVWFNMAVIWLFSFILYLVLLLNVPDRLMKLL